MQTDIKDIVFFTTFLEIMSCIWPNIGLDLSKQLHLFLKLLKTWLFDAKHIHHDVEHHENQNQFLRQSGGFNRLWPNLDPASEISFAGLQLNFKSIQPLPTPPPTPETLNLDQSQSVCAIRFQTLHCCIFPHSTSCISLDGSCSSSETMPQLLLCWLQLMNHFT